MFTHEQIKWRTLWKWSLVQKIKKQEAFYKINNEKLSS